MPLCVFSNIFSIADLLMIGSNALMRLTSATSHNILQGIWSI